MTLQQKKLKRVGVTDLIVHDALHWAPSEIPHSLPNLGIFKIQYSIFIFPQDETLEIMVIEMSPL